MPTADLNRRKASAATPTVVVTGFGLLFLVFGVIFAARADWINTAICAGTLVGVALVAFWAGPRRAMRMRPAAARDSTAAQSEGVRGFTRWEAVGHAGMACLYVAALSAAVFTGDWGWPLAAALSSLVGVAMLGAQIRRGSVPSDRDAVNALL
ncbi:hypothetical protein [Leucobacter sp. G161]|uniref:hypothetical protein n=1 Tax=Leucobacter sp. G161 TaxID=663704 RepID=UPI000ADE97CC|nr:hypothetical protein [Leucobacter sp. G161]